MAGPILDHGWRRAIGLTIALWLFVGIIYLPMLIERHPDGWRSIALDLSTVLLSMVLGIGCYAVFRATHDWEVWRRGLALPLAIASVSLIQTVFDYQFTRWVASSWATWRFVPQSPARSYGAMFNYVCVFGVNVALFHLAAARERAEQQRRDLATALSTAQAAQLAALRFQLNPHFLFNTLNAISAMIVTRRNEAAEEMTTKLSAFLRNSLDADPQALVALDEELALIEDYLEIERVRFGDRLRVRTHSEGDAGTVPVPGFLLQPLVENAVKYGVSRSRVPVTVAVTARLEAGRLHVTVEDDAAPRTDAAPQPGTGTGLANVARRLDALYGAEATLETMQKADGFCVSITLPARGR